ncbi:MAG: restriction endonuclease subunit S [Hyphomicrobiales bacterium]|nr:MAG: restriction endonuclease subunit S [Hyphomicrobiales bacterium]
MTGSKIGRVSATSSEHGGAYISQHVAIIRVDRQKLLPDFLSFYLSLRDGGQRQIEKCQYGQTKPGLNFEQIRAFEIPRPPLPLQQSFCERISLSRALIKQEYEHINSMNTLFSSLQHRAFTGQL